ncbi:MAG: hypothetical protein JWO03_1013 [Bacteroidetes bacterium]|nr:hypothetical protein [Bacteroidota bacterium]
MLFITGFYLVFNILAGAVLSAYYFKREHYTVYGHEILLLLLFPAAGLGYWIYHRDLRENIATDLPLNWYIWKHMVKIHTALMIALGLFAISTLSGCGAMVGGGLHWADHQNNASAVGLGLMYNAVSGVVFGLILLFVLLGLGITGLLMIGLPAFIAHSIKSNVYMMKYQQEKEKKQMDKLQDLLPNESNDTRNT